MTILQMSKLRLEDTPVPERGTRGLSQHTGPPLPGLLMHNPGPCLLLTLGNILGLSWSAGKSELKQKQAWEQL